MAKRTKKLSRPQLKLEALEQRQLLAGISGSGTEVGTDIHHSNGNVYDQVLLKGSSVSVTADAGQVTRVSFLDAQGDIVQAEFSGAGQLTVSMADGYKTDIAPDKYLQTGVAYVQGLASFSITGSDASTNFTVFSVGSVTGTNGSLFDATHTGGDHLANVARLTIVADPSNPNGSLFGGIKAGNALFSADSGVVGITAANVQVQTLVRVQDIDAMGTATPALVFGGNSQFVSVDVQGGDLVQTNGKAINNSGSYGYSIGSVANVDAAGNALPAKTITAATAPFTDQSPYPAPKSYTLTTAIDNIVGSAADDVINGSHTNSSLVVSALDKVDGLGGNDLLNISDSDGGTAQLSGLTVKNVESFLYTSTGKLGSSDTLDTTGWTGLTSASVTLQNIAAGVETLKATKDTSVVINSTSAGTPGQWAITGGKTVTLTNAGGTGTLGAAITGVNGTTAVNVTQTTSAGVLGAVDVTDWATGSDNDKVGTITSVTLNGAVGSTIASNALTTVSLTKVTGTVTVADPLSGHTTAPTVLAVATNDSTYTLKDDNGTLQQINFTASGKTSTVTVNPDSHNVLTTITVAGDQKLTLGDLSTGFGDKFVTLTGTGTGTVSATVNAGVAVTTGAGADAITINAATKKAVSVGDGNDWVSAVLSSGKLGSGGSIDGGAGTDTLALTADSAVTATATTDLAGTISGFEKLELGAGLSGAGAIDLHNLDDINQIVVNADMANTLTLKNLPTGTSVEYKVDQAAGTVINIPVAAVQNETVSLKLSGNGTNAAQNIDANSIDTGLVTTVALNSSDTKTDDATVPVHTVTLSSGSLKTINVSGNAGLTITNSGAGATTIDATASTKGDFTVTLGAVQADVTVKGTTAGGNTIDTASILNTKTATITTGGDNPDTITVGIGGSTVNAGDGANTFNVGGGNNTYTGGGGVDTVNLNGTIGTNTINLGDGNDVVHVNGTTSGQTTINLGGNDDTVDFNAIPGTAGYFVTINGAANNDKIDIGTIMHGTATIGAQVVLGSGVSFSDFLDAASASATAGANSVVRWFNYGGDTYIVVDGGAATTFNAATDMVVKLGGTINLASGNTTMGIDGAGLITI